MKKLIISILALLFTSTIFSQTIKYDYLVTLKTDFGVVKIILFDDTPIHKQNFLAMIKAGKYNNNTFHRVINDFMIQGGTDTSNYMQGKKFEDYTLPAELNTKHTHVYGAVAAARVENPEKRSDQTQFYIVENCGGTHFLDGQYTVFGQVVSGLNVVSKIAEQPVDAGSKPITTVKFTITVEKIDQKILAKYYNIDF